MKNTKQKYNYSKLQYFFWLISGAEINILKDCPTDYNRQAGIGFTIFMTTFLAFCSGSYAGYYFGEGENRFWFALIFGLIWATLIFSIDRSMVVTLKKDPTIQKQKFWIPLLSRAGLAIIIAFVISIPLELLIFKDNIDIHKPKFKQDKTLNIIEGQTKIENLGDQKFMLTNVDSSLNELENEFSIGEPQNDPIFKDLKAKKNTAEQKFTSLKRKYTNLDINTKNAYNRGDMEKYRNLTIARRNAKQEVDKYSLEYNKIDKEFKKYINDWRNEMRESIQSLKEDKTRINKKIRQGIENVNGSSREMDSLLKKHDDSFVFNFMVLEDLAQRYKKVKINPNENINSSIQDTIANEAQTSLSNQIGAKEEYKLEYDPEGESVLFLLWLIRILFILIEILPTIAKISTPVGAYDKAIYYKEKLIEEDLLKKNQDFLRQQEEIREFEHMAQLKQIEERNKLEKKLHKELLTEIAFTQNEIAKKKIEEFRSKHL